MKSTVVWQTSSEGLTFTGTNDNGLSLTLDGSGKGISPMESVLMAMGACSSVDVVEIMRKAKQDMQHCEVQLSAERAENAPRVFTKVHAKFVIRGEQLNEKHVARAISLSTEKYCSVMLMFNEKVDISTSYEIVD